jgi:hypothetical protein
MQRLRDFFEAIWVAIDGLWTEWQYRDVEPKDRDD